MDVFNGNHRLQDHIMYALDWAIFLRHNLDGPLIPFLFEWKEEKLFMNMLEPGGDPEEFAYRIAEKSERQADQFVLGYEGVLTDDKGEKNDAFIIKGYDRTQPKGVFIAQIFHPKEKTGDFKVIDTPIFINNPELPFKTNTDISPHYNSEELSFTGINLKNNNQMGIFTHDNPSVIANGIKKYIRGKLAGDGAELISGNIECVIAPIVGNSEFLKYTVLRAIQYVKKNEFVKAWEDKFGKTLRINCKYGDEIWLKEFENVETQNESENSQDDKVINKNDDGNQDLIYIKYSKLNKQELDNEFFRIASIPNARTKIDCLNEMTSLMKVYKEKGIDMPTKKQKSNSGCGAILLILIICGAIIRFFI